MQGDRNADYKVANEKLGINGKRGKPTQKAHNNEYGDVVWHHASYDAETNTCVMQLVTTADHKAEVPHEGAVKQFEDATGTKYGSDEAEEAAAKLNEKEAEKKLNNKCSQK